MLQVLNFVSLLRSVVNDFILTHHIHVKVFTPMNDLHKSNTICDLVVPRTRSPWSVGEWSNSVAPFSGVRNIVPSIMFPQGSEEKTVNVIRVSQSEKRHLLPMFQVKTWAYSKDWGGFPLAKLTGFKSVKAFHKIRTHAIFSTLGGERLVKLKSSHPPDTL
jgi:hypothetical protein